MKINHEINIPTLKKLDFTFISISSSKLIEQSDRLTDVRISQSEVTEIDLREFKKLENLELISNKIENIDSFCSKDWRTLKTMYLTENKITSVPKMTKFPLLEILHLGENQIENVNDLMENSMLLSLTYLYLSRNKIKNIKGIKNLPKLAALYLE